MSQFNAPTYDVERPTGQCTFTGRKLAPGEHYMAVLVDVDLEGPSAPAKGSAIEGDGGSTLKSPIPNPKSQISSPASAAGSSSRVGSVLGFRRIDVSMEAWQAGSRPERVFSYWRSIVPEPNQKRRVFVDDEVLMNLFRRLADSEQPQRLAFRFVLALILMRKRLLRYEGGQKRPRATGEGEPQEWWKMASKTVAGAEPEYFDVLDPQLDEAQIQQVTQQLGEVLEGEI